MSGWKRVYFTTFRPVGGVVKVFDYVNHALTLGYEPVICLPEPYKKGLSLFQIPRLSHISPKNGIRFAECEQVKRDFRTDDIIIIQRFS